MEHDDLVAGRYRLDQPVAAGTMGEVWRALDTRLNRPVAVKLLRPDLPDGEAARARFAAEATVVSALSAPQLATVHDYGEAADGDTVRPYLVMEWTDGRPLSALLAESGRLSIARTVRIVTETAAALRVAHEAGIVHRDVKPGNILLTDDGSVKLIDFGIAVARGESGRDESGTITGTPAYLSPEQITNWKLTPGADVYGLGTVAYECLTGAPPFDSDNATETLADHLTKPPGPMPDHVPGQAADVIERALRKRAANRWPSVTAFAVALHDSVPAAPDPPTPVPEPEPSAKPETERRSRRGLVLQLAGLAIVAVLLAAAGLLLWPTTDSGPTDHKAAEHDPRDPETDGGSATADGDDAADDPAGGRDPGDPQPESDDPNPTGGEPGDGDDDSGQTVPDLTGTSTYAVPYELRMHGFANSDGRARSAQAGEMNCVVTGQKPEPGSKVDPATTIVYYYRAPSYGCGPGARVAATPDVAVRPAAQPRAVTRRRVG